MWLKKHWSTLLLIGILLAGVGLIGYPTFSDWWNSFHQSRAIAGYAEQVSQINDDDYKKMLEEARACNEELLNKGDGRFNMKDEERERYNGILDISGTGIMGYVNIPKINVSLPIYHGTDESVLQIAVGHIEGTSFPVGGTGTHAVISGHRGLPSAKLFTDLDQLVEGDIFQITVLDETLTYEVDQIRIVMPNELEELAIDPEKDYFTLVTCTPYGINSHRMLVRGHRIENPDKGDVRVTSDATHIEPLQVLPVVLAIILGIALVIILISSRRRKKNLEVYRKATRERHEKEMRFSKAYYYKRHPDQDRRNPRNRMNQTKDDRIDPAQETEKKNGKRKGKARKKGRR